MTAMAAGTTPLASATMVSGDTDGALLFIPV
jgi:hypothetical protein